MCGKMQRLESEHTSIKALLEEEKSKGQEAAKVIERQENDITSLKKELERLNQEVDRTNKVLPVAEMADNLQHQVRVDEVIHASS